MTTLALQFDRAYTADDEPLPVVSGVLTVVVHAVFAAILFLNMSWHEKLPDHATVKLWESLPVNPPKTTTIEKPKVDKPAVKTKQQTQPAALEHTPALQIDPVVPQPVVSQPVAPQPMVTRPVVPQPLATQPVAVRAEVRPVAQAEMPTPDSPSFTPPSANLAAPVRAKPDQLPPPTSTPVTFEPKPITQPVQFNEREVGQPVLDVDKIKRERALALAELLRNEEQNRLDKTIDQERDQRATDYKKRLAEHERKLEQGLQEIEAATQARRQQDSERTAREAAARQITDDYRARISAKIRQRVILPPDLAGNPEAIYEVSVLPGGDVTQARLLRTSGFATYDAAVERAIFAAQPLPVPKDPAVFQANFKSLHLSFRPKE